MKKYYIFLDFTKGLKKTISSAILFMLLLTGYSQTTLVSWDFPNTTDDAIADGGIAANSAKTIYSSGTNPLAFTNSGSTTRCASATGWDISVGNEWWETEFSTAGYTSITIQSKQYGSGNKSPRDFKIQYKIGSGGTWTDAGITCTAGKIAWNTLSETTLPSACDNQTSVYIRWIVNSTTNVNGATTVDPLLYSAIDDIIVKGTPTCTALSGTKTIGASGCDYPTITAAVNALNNCGVSGPVVFQLKDATYSTSETFPITINAITGASATNTITFRPFTGVTSTISGSVASGALIKLNTSKYITFDGSNSGGTDKNLTIQNTSTTSPNALWIGGSVSAPAQNDVIKNCVIINGINSSSAIIISDATTSGTAGYFNNITLQNNTIQKAYMGIYAIATVAAGNGSGLLITGNDLTTSGTNAIKYIGVYVQGVDGATVSSNTIGNFETSSDEYDRGIWFATGTVNSIISGNNISSLNYSGTSSYAPKGICISSGTSSSGLTINSNTVSGLSSSGTGTTSGIYLLGATSGVTISSNNITNIKNTNSSGYSAEGITLASSSTTASTTVSNNFISDVAGYGYSSSSADNGYGINISTGGGYKLYFNSINLATNQTSATGLPACLIINSAIATASSLDIRNNIFSIPASVGTNRYAVLCNAANTVFSYMDYNDYYTSGSNLGYIGAANRSDLAAWKTGTGKDVNSVSVSPTFTSSTNLHLTSSVGNAVTGTGITTDIDGDTRSGSTPSMGADEAAPCVSPTCTAPATTPASYCQNASATALSVTGTAGSGTISSYKWYSNTSASNSGGTLVATHNVSTGTDTYTPATTATGTLYYYVVVTNSNSCTIASAVSGAVTITALPSAVTITPSSANICTGGIQSLVASGGTVGGSSILSENFNGGTNSWTKTNNSTGGTPANAAWTLRADGYLYSTTYFYSNDNSQFYMSNSDAQGSGGTTATILQSPSFSTVGYSSATLSFYHYIKTPTAAAVEYSLNGSDWVNLKTYTSTQGTASTFVQDNISLPAGALNQATVYIRFKYDDAYGYYWAIDNVTISGSETASLSWSPTTGLYTDAGATVAYTGTSTNTVYAKPASTTTYTASATSGGCSTTANATVTIAPLSCGALTTGGATTCAGVQTVTAHPSGGGTPYSYAWKEDGAAIGGTTATIFPNSGTHTYACIVTDNCGSTCSSSLSVTSSASPTITSQPVADTTLVGTTTTFSITASGSPTYQWQYATSASGPWSNVANGTPANVTYTGGTTATLSVIVGSTATTGSGYYYQCVATIGSCSATSANAQLTISNYCPSVATSATDEDIFNVTFGTLNNSSTCSTTGGTGSVQSKYSNYTGVAAPDVQQGATVAFSVQVGTCGGNYSNACAIWIDYNHDGDFEDVGEDVYAAPSGTTGAHTETGNIIIPMTALTGNTRMRIICQETPVTSDPCEPYEYGETEDYLINITLAPACSGTPTAGTTNASSTSVCSGTLSSLSVTGATSGYSGLTYQWQSSSDNSNWSNISAATGLTYSAYPTANTYYRRAITCSGATTYSSSVLVSVVTCFNMDNTPVATCSGNFYDSGGASGNYSYSETFTKTFTSSTSGNALQFTFSAFTTESSLDYLYVYDGPTTASPQVTGSPFSGSSLPSAILSSGTSLTFKFTSDGSDQYAGWAASISCVPITVPNCPTLSSPANATSTICPGSGATLTWTPSGTGFAATSYQLYFGTNNPPTNIINDINVGNVTSYETGPLASNTTYYWKIVPVNSIGGNNTCTTVYSFSTQNIAISSTNSPVTTCLNTATLTATSGGTINWYDQPTGGTLLGTGGSLVRTFSGNATYYVGASNGSTSDQTTGLPGPNTNTMSSASMGVRFTTLAALTLKTVDVYVTTAGTNLTVRLQNTSSTDLLTKTFTNMPAGKNTLTLNFAIPTAGNYILISEDGVSMGYHDAYSTYPITLAGVMSITSGEWWGVSTTSYGYFYNWVVSAGSTCESARVPVNIVHTASPITITPSGPTTFALGGSVDLSASSAASPAYTYTWSPATGLNTTSGATVTANPSSTTTYTVVGTNGTPCTQTASVTVEVIQPCTGLGSSGVTNISALPYSVSGQTTVGMGNEITSTTAIICGSSTYYTGNDVVYVFTPTVSGSSTITLTTVTGTYTGLMLYDGCPMNGQGGACVSYSQSSTGNKSMCVSLNAGTTYYLVLDYYSASATIPSNYSLTISAPDPASTPNDLPCNADVLNTGDLTPGENTCATGVDEPVAPSCWTNGNINTVWYKLTTGASQTSIKIKTVVGSLLNTQIAIYSGACGSSMALVACNDDVAACGSSYYKNSELTATVTANTTYYVAVDGYSDQVGTFSIVWIDGAASWPPVPGQDCGTEVPVCSATFAIGNPGYQAVGNNCDFGTSYCLASGERGSAWYEVKINANGNLMFTIEPNDVIPAIGTAGTVTNYGTDYDWAVWKKTGTGAISCSQIASGSATPLRCNYSGIGITGLYTGGVTPPSNTYTNHTYTSGSYDAAFETPIPVLAGESYYVVISNYSNSLSGFTVNFTNSSNGFDFTVPDPLVWTGGGASTDWFDSKNWGNCSEYPDETHNCVIAASSSYQPIINATGAKCKSITINPGATLTINNGYDLEIRGNYNNQGLLVANPTSTITLTNSVAQTLDGIMVSPSEFSNLIINKTGNGVTLNQNLEVSGNLTLSSSSYGLNGNNNNISVGGNIDMALTTFTPGATGMFTIIGSSTTHTINSRNNAFSNFTMDQTGQITLANNVAINGTLTLSNGIMNTGTYKVTVNNTDPLSVNNGSATSYINGNLRRYIASNTGVYAFPIGTALAYRLAQLSNNNMTGISYLDGKFESNFTSTGSLNPAIAIDLGTAYSSLATEGIWTISPDVQPSGGSYGINLWFDGGGSNAFSGLTDLAFGVLKRSTGSTTANVWSSQGGSLDATGRMVADGYARRIGWTAFSEFVIGKASGALPVSLLTAQMICENNHKVIKWSTASEVNNQYFSILSSTNAIDFQEVARVNGAGNSNTTIQYQWVDTSVTSNDVMYYQLKQTDNNGTQTSLSLLSGNCEEGSNGDIVIISNPSNPNIEARFTGDQTGKYSIKLVNYLGQVVMTKEVNLDKEGNLVFLAKKGLATGIYNLVFKNKKEVITKQVLVTF